MYKIISLALLTTPLSVFAQAPGNLQELLDIFTNIISILIPIIFALVFIRISWGVVRTWIMGEGSPDEIEQGKKIVFVGVIALAIMASVWGIVAIVQNTLFG